MTREGFCHISFCKFIDFRKKDFFMEQEPIARTVWMKWWKVTRIRY